MRKFLVLLLCYPVLVWSQSTPPQLADVVSLDASASMDVPYDKASATLAYDEQGAVPADLIDNASRALDAALAQAKVVKEVVAHTGQFSTYPVYGKDQQVAGWRVHAELILESSDFKALSALTGKLATRLALGNVSYSLSQPSRKAAEKKLIDEAIAAYRDKARAAAQAFGYSGYHLREVSLSSGGGPQPRIMGGVASKFASSAVAVPMEAGQATVTMTVTGSVKLEK